MHMRTKIERISLTHLEATYILDLFSSLPDGQPKEGIPMKWVVLAASTAITATLWLPGEAAQPAAPEAAALSAPTGEAISFEQYRDWRLSFIERRQIELAVELAATDLPALQKTRLEHSKAYFDWFAGLPAAERDRRFRERFDRIDANHDGQIDQGERGAWRERQRAFYHRDRTQRPSAEAAPQHPTEAAAN
jgi:hypothetical protein